MAIKNVLMMLAQRHTEEKFTSYSMTKGELKTAIDKAGGSRDHRATEWNEAFNQYNQANKHSQVKRGPCGSCYRKVYEWLSK